MPPIDSARVQAPPPPPPPPPIVQQPVRLAAAQGPLPAQGPQPAPPAQPPAVSAARTEIDRRIEGTGFLGAQTQGDDQAIVDTLTGLSPQDANTVVRGLATDNRLNDVTGTITSSGVFTGTLSADARRDFMTTMAQRLDGPNLGALSRSFDAIGGDRGVEGARYAQELASAVATHATPDQKLGFVQNLAPDTVRREGNTQFENGPLSQTTHLTNPQARAVAEVLSSMRGANLEQAFMGLSADQRQAVFQAGTDQRLTNYTGSQGGAQPSFNTELYGRLAEATATMPGDHARAQAFAAGAEVLRDVQPRGITSVVAPQYAGPANDAANAMAGSLAKIIDSNPFGVVSDLNRYQSAQPGTGDIGTWNGTGLASYARQMMSQGTPGQEVLGRQLGLVAAGDGTATNPTDAFNQLSPDGKFRTAEALGYFVGATSAGVASLTGDNAAQNQLIGNTLASGLTLLDKSGIAATAAAVAKDWIRSAVTSVNAAGASDPVTTFTEAAVPDVNGYTSAESNAESIFGGRSNHVRTNAGL